MVTSTSDGEESTYRKMWQKEQVLIILLIPLEPITGKDLYSLSLFYQELVGKKYLYSIKTRNELQRQLKVLLIEKKVSVRGGRYIITDKGKSEARAIRARLSRREEKKWAVCLSLGRKILHETRYSPTHFSKQLRRNK